MTKTVLPIILKFTRSIKESVMLRNLDIGNNRLFVIVQIIFNVNKWLIHKSVLLGQAISPARDFDRSLRLPPDF
jgi:hypothetical protein